MFLHLILQIQTVAKQNLPICLCVLKQIGPICFIFRNFASVIILKMTSLSFLIGPKRRPWLGGMYIHSHVSCHLENKF